MISIFSSIVFLGHKKPVENHHVKDTNEDATLDLELDLKHFNHLTHLILTAETIHILKTTLETFKEKNLSKLDKLTKFRL